MAGAKLEAQFRDAVAAIHAGPASFAAIALLACTLVTAQSTAPIAQAPAPGKRVEVRFLGHTRATEVTDPKAGGWSTIRIALPEC